MWPTKDALSKSARGSVTRAACLAMPIARWRSRCSNSKRTMLFGILVGIVSDEQRPTIGLLLRYLLAPNTTLHDHSFLMFHPF